MRHSKLIVPVAALLILALLAGSALAESTLGALWTAGADFLFHTDNVTVIGDATFSLDGVWFKTAHLDYTQDGYSSFFGLNLVTPKKDGTEREGGWTVIAGEDGSIAVMETFYPGTYRQGYGTENNTLLRRSIQLDALVELGGFIVEQMDGLLPEGAVAVTGKEDGKAVHIQLSADQIPAMAVSALNVGARFLSDRWFSYSHDRETAGYEPPFESYLTVTEALTGGTVKWTLGDVDVEIALDASGRLTAVSGNVKATSTYWDGTEREVAVQLDLSVKDYGTSHVKPFDPADYHVKPQYPLYGEEAAEEAGE